MSSIAHPLIVPVFAPGWVARAARGIALRGLASSWPESGRLDLHFADGARLVLGRGERTLAKIAIRYPLMTLQVIGLIYWEALRMHLAGVPFRRPTDPPYEPARTERAAR